MISNRIRACNGLDRFIEAELKTLNESMDNDQIDSDESGVGPDGLYHTYEAVDFSGAGYDFDTIQEAQMFADETNNVSEIKEWSFDNPKKLKPVSSKVVWKFSETKNMGESIDNSACIEKKIKDSDEDNLTDQEKEFLDFKKDKPLKESAYTYLPTEEEISDYQAELGDDIPEEDEFWSNVDKDDQLRFDAENDYQKDESLADNLHISDCIDSQPITETISDAFKNKEYVVAFEDREGVHKKAFRTEQEAKKYASRLREEGEENIKIGTAKYGQTHANNQFQKRMDDRDAHNQEVADAEREEQHAKASVKHTGSKVRDYSSFTRGTNSDVDEYSNAKRNYQQKHNQANELKKKGFDDSKYDTKMPGFFKRLKNKSSDFKGEALGEQLLKEARKQFCVELYLDTQKAPERIEFETYTEAKSFAEEYVNDAYEAIYILQYGVNGPSEITRWEKGYGWTNPLPGFETPFDESLNERYEFKEVDDAIYHFRNDLGIGPEVDDVVEYLENNYSDIVPQDFDQYQKWYSEIAGEISARLNESLNEAEEDNNIIKTAKAKLGMKESLLSEDNKEIISAGSLERDLDEWFNKGNLFTDEISVTEDELGPGMHGYLITWEINWGDWKHEHLRSKILFQEFCAHNNLPGEYVGEEVTEEDGSDTYSATHTAFIEIFDDSILEENLDESFDAPVREKANKLYRRIANISDDVVITESNLNEWAYKRAAVTLNCSFDRMKDYLGVMR